MERLEFGHRNSQNFLSPVAESESPIPQVFISYQWDAQDQARSLRDFLERLGYACWMDVGQMGGGDHLNAKIDEGLRNCKVYRTTFFLMCMKPKVYDIYRSLFIFFFVVI